MDTSCNETTIWNIKQNPRDNLRRSLGMFCYWEKEHISMSFPCHCSKAWIQMLALLYVGTAPSGHMTWRVVQPRYMQIARRPYRIFKKNPKKTTESWWINDYFIHHLTLEKDEPSCCLDARLSPILPWLLILLKGVRKCEASHSYYINYLEMHTDGATRLAERMSQLKWTLELLRTEEGPLCRVVTQGHTATCWNNTGG